MIKPGPHIIPVMLALASFGAFPPSARAAAAAPLPSARADNAGALDIAEAYEMISGALSGSRVLPALPPETVLGAAAPARDGAPGLEDLRKAKAELESLIARLSVMIAKETDSGKKIEFYELREAAQKALDGVKAALEKSERGGAGREKEARLEQAISEAKFLNKMLASYLGENDFAWTVHFKRAAFEFEVGGDAVYEAIRKRLPFIGGAVRGRFRVNPGAEMISQFNAAKAEYYTTLLEAAQALKSLGKAPFSDARLMGMAKWGNDTKVIYPGKDWMSAQPILTDNQYNSLD